MSSDVDVQHLDRIWVPKKRALAVRTYVRYLSKNTYVIQGPRLPSHAHNCAGLTRQPWRDVGNTWTNDTYDWVAILESIRREPRIKAYVRHLKLQSLGPLPESPACGNRDFSEVELDAVSSLYDPWLEVFDGIDEKEAFTFHKAAWLPVSLLILHSPNIVTLEWRLDQYCEGHQNLLGLLESISAYPPQPAFSKLHTVILYEQPDSYRIQSVDSTVLSILMALPSVKRIRLASVCDSSTGFPLAAASSGLE